MNSTRPLKTVFFGTPDFAVPTLAAMVEHGYAPSLVMSQPSRPVGRKRKLQPPPVAVWAMENELQLRQPESVREKDFMAEMAEIAPDVAVVVAYGQIFRKRLLSLPRLGCVNVHASLLPTWRGAAPIQASIAAGQETTGVTTMLMERGLDSGPMLLRDELRIGERETAGELSPRLANLGAELLIETLRRLERDDLEPIAQDDSAATFAPRLLKADGLVDWTLDAQTIYNRLRAFTPWPGLTSTLREQPVKLLGMRVLAADLLPDLPRSLQDGPGGELLGMQEERLMVRCGNGTILGLETLQRPGRKPVSAVDFVNGEHLRPGEFFSPPPSSA